ncbi:MAG: hypothetical protein AB1600_04570, partial [Bacteroidota bacterium]
MKSMLIKSISVVSFTFFTTFSQDTLTNSDHRKFRFDGTSDEIERFINSVVDDVEKRLDDFVEGKRGERHSSLAVELQETDSTSNDALTFNGDTEIAESDTIVGDLVVKNGLLTIRGTVLGDVLVVNGDIRVKSTARVKGNMRAMNGTITKDDGAIVGGYTEESNKSYESKRKRTSRARYSYTFKPFMWYDTEINDNFLFRYNRVEGFFFGFGSRKEYYWDGSKSLSGFGSFGYGFASHRWRMQLGLDRQFATSSGLYEVGGEVHSLTDTKDEWIMKLGENNLAALLFH